MNENKKTIVHKFTFEGYFNGSKENQLIIGGSLF
jgi:hypothetical protein